MTHLLVFLSAALYEMAFLLWSDSATQRRPVRAAIWSAGVGALSLYGVSHVVRDTGYAVALLGGYAVGSWATVRWLVR